MLWGFSDDIGGDLDVMEIVEGSVSLARAFDTPAALADAIRVARLTSSASVQRLIERPLEYDDARAPSRQSRISARWIGMRALGRVTAWWRARRAR